jgi:flavin-dependent dehydrogenase
MGGIVDRYRRVVVDDRPPITGVALLADAWACTNPSLGRGITLGLLHATHLRDIARSALDDPREFAAVWDTITETHLTPWYRDTVMQDRARLREIEALRTGVALPAPDALRAALPVAVMHDPDVFRIFVENRCCLTPLEDALARPGIVDRILEVAREHEALPAPGPDREQLLALLS